MLPLAADGRHQRIRRLVRQRVGTSDELAGARYQAALELERAAEAAVDAGAFFVAFYEERFDELPVSASLSASVTPTGRTSPPPSRSAASEPGPSPPAPVDATPANGDRSLAQAMADVLARGEGEHDDVSVVELPLGAAVRCRSRAHTDLWGSQGKELRPVSVQYMVPLASSDHMLTMSFATPIVPLADRFVELFDTMARTARID